MTTYYVTCPNILEGRRNSGGIEICAKVNNIIQDKGFDSDFNLCQSILMNGYEPETIKGFKIRVAAANNG